MASETYFYRLGHECPEDSDWVTLMHEDCFDNVAFELLVMGVLPDVVRRLIEENKIERLKKPVTFQSLFNSVAEQLCEKHGFRVIKYSATFMPFGWADVTDRESWANEPDNGTRARMIATLEAAGISIRSGQ